MSDEPVHRHFFHLLLAAVTIALGWILLPFFGAVFWGAILAIIFQPMQRYLAARLGKRRNLAALTTLLGTILIAILPQCSAFAKIADFGNGLSWISNFNPNHKFWLSID